MKDLSNSRRGSTSQNQPSDAIIIFHPNRLRSLQQQQQQQRQSHANLGFHLQQQNICGPVSYSAARFLDFLRLTKKDEKNLPQAQPKKEENAEEHHMFLINDSKNESHENFEHENADRALFVQNVMLSMLQQQEFQP